MSEKRPDIRSEVARAVISGAAERQRAYRARLRCGRMTLLVEVHDANVPAKLVAEGWLRERQADDRDSVQAALSKFLEDWAAP